MPAIPQAAIGGADGDVMLTIDQFAEATASRNPPLATKNLLGDTDGCGSPLLSADVRSSDDVIAF